jgi:hypothetical protein
MYLGTLTTRPQRRSLGDCINQYHFQESPRRLRKPKAHYRVQKSLSGPTAKLPIHFVISFNNLQNPRLCLRSNRFLSCFPTKILQAFLIPPTPLHLTLPDLKIGI